MRVLVCGGRDFNDADFIYDCLSFVDASIDRIDTIIEGGAKGADIIAGAWGDQFGRDVEQYNADWNTYGKRAGYIRNAQMLEEGRPDIVVAFPGGRGTEMMIKLAKSSGVPCYTFDPVNIKKGILLE